MDEWAREVWGDIFGLDKRMPATPPGDVAKPAASTPNKPTKPGRQRHAR